MHSYHRIKMDGRKAAAVRVVPPPVAVKALVVTAAVAAVVALTLLPLPAGAQGGAAALTVRVRPDRAHATPGGEVRFAARAFDASGEEVAAAFSWSLIPPRLGRVDDGLFRSNGTEGRGVVRVVASHGGARGTGHAVIDVSPGPAVRLSVVLNPPRAALAPNERVQFDAFVTDPQTGSPVDAELAWSVVPAELGSVDAAGLFVAAGFDGSGRVVARASAGGRQGLGDAGVTVGATSPSGIRIAVAPSGALVSPGGEVRFEARVTDESGEPVQAEVSWSVVPARLGHVGPAGAFVAGPEQMAGRVVATAVTAAGPVRGFASVEIKRPGPGNLRIRIRPQEVALAPGGDAQFEAEFLGPDGEPLDVPVNWSVRPPWLGTITSGGLFIASDDFPQPSQNGAWTGNVIASLETSSGPVSDAARVRIREDGPPRRLRIRPQRATVAPAQDIQFEAIVLGAGDLDDWATEWAVFPENLGTITPDGLFTANPMFGDPSSGEFGPHEGMVGARVTFDDGSTLTARAHVRVHTVGHPVRILVRPAFAVVPPGGEQQFEAVVLGPDGEELEFPVVWRVAPHGLGTVTPDGLFTAADVSIDPGSWSRPHGQVVAELTIGMSRVFRGVAAVIIDLPDPEVSVRVSPKSMTLEPGESFRFEASVFDAEGTPLELPVEWRVSDPIVGTVTPDGTFTASEQMPPGHARNTTVVAGATHGGRIYWDFASVRVTMRDQ